MRNKILSVVLPALLSGLYLSATEKIFDCGFENDMDLQLWKKSSSRVDCRLTKDTFHSGSSSLLIEDNDMGRSSSSLYMDLPVRKYAGKRIHFSAWIKQEQSSGRNGNRIQIQWRTKNGVNNWKYSGISEKEALPWNFYEIFVDIPKDTIFLRISLMCVQGFGGTGKAFFDDIQIKSIQPQKEAVTSIKANKTETGLLFLGARELPEGWTLRDKNPDLLCELREDPQTRNIFLRLTGKRISKKGPAVIFSGALNRRLNMSGKIEILMKPKKKISLFSVPFQFEDTDNDGWSRGVCILPHHPLQKEFRLKFDEATKEGESVIIKRIHIEFASIDRTFAPEILAELKRLFEKRPPNTGARPEIRNGTFYMSGEPRFLSGPWLNNILVTRDFGHPLPFLKDPVYTSSFNEETGKRFKMESLQLSSASNTPFLLKSGWPVDQSALQDLQGTRKFYIEMGKMPFTQDFAWINNLRSKVMRMFPEKWNELEQQNRDWHEFVPFCPEHPITRKLYHDLYRCGTEYALISGANVYLHELFNEPNYMCFCRFNQENFLKCLKEKYKNIETMNKTLGSSFKTFEEISKLPHYRNSRGLWVEWCKFIGSRYASILKELGDTIRSVDGRKNRYITEMCSAGNIYFARGAGMDFRKNAAVLDVLGMEGGWTYGRPGKVSSSNPMLDVLHIGNHDLVLDFYAALSKGKKPVINLEHYCRRLEGRQRIPSRKEDIISSLWREIFHGSSGAHFYAWERRAWSWKTMEEARKVAESNSACGANLLNPYAYPLSSLEGFRIFQEELAPLRELVLPFPRTWHRNVAMVYSYPTFRLSPLTGIDFGACLKNCYTILQRNHYAMQIVFEEEISLEKLQEFDAVVLPALRNSYASTRKIISEYIRKGGVVIWSRDSLIEDEYGHGIDQEEFKKGTNSFFCNESFQSLDGAKGVLKGLQTTNVHRDFTINHPATELTCIERNGSRTLLIFNQLDEPPQMLVLKSFGSSREFVGKSV